MIGSASVCQILAVIGAAIAGKPVGQEMQTGREVGFQKSAEFGPADDDAGVTGQKASRAFLAALAASRQRPLPDSCLGCWCDPECLHRAYCESLRGPIWEAASGGLFGTSPIAGVSPGSRSVTTPDQVALTAERPASTTS